MLAESLNVLMEELQMITPMIPGVVYEVDEEK